MQGKTLCAEVNQNAVANKTRLNMTSGEVFSDGSVIELIGNVRGGDPQLLLWDGANQTVGPVVEHSGIRYQAAQFPKSILRELTLPMGHHPHGTTRELLAEICKLIEDFAGLSTRFASLAARFLLCDWLLEAVRVAPTIVATGPDVMRGNRLMELLRCFCRHGVRMTGLTPAGLRSLPSGAGFTLLISQPTISAQLENLLGDVSHRDHKILCRGELLDLFGAQVIHAESVSHGESLALRSIRIPMVPGDAQLPAFDLATQQQITLDFQSKLLSFRRANLIGARKLQFDSSRFIFSLRELAITIATATPDDIDLQSEVFELLHDQNEEIRAGKWVQFSAAVVESLLVGYYESPEGFVYIGELAKIAQEILIRRGEESSIDPGEFGKRLKFLGFMAEPRDGQGVQIHLTEAVSRRAKDLARDFGTPEVEKEAPPERMGKDGLGAR